MMSPGLLVCGCEVAAWSFTIFHATWWVPPVLDYVNTITLEEIKKTHPVSWALQGCVALLQTLAKTLIALHKMGIVHWDIKPSNVRIHRCMSSVTLVDIGHCGVKINVEPVPGPAADVQR
eukprot:228092-Rhodomonas_salina.1